MASTIINEKQFKQITSYLQQKYGLYFKSEKLSLLQSRLSKRLRALNMDCYDNYIEFLFETKNADEYKQFIDLVTTHKTSFFREDYQFDFLKNLLHGSSQFSNKKLNVWSAGCSSGEEIYTLAMLLNENKTLQPSFDFNIVGTDISVPVLKKAARGVYSQNEVLDLPQHLLRKYFDPILKEGKSYYKFNKADVKSKIKLGALNLNNAHYNLKEEFDIIFCRNVIIYFDAETQKKVISKLLQKLKAGGYLFLGHSETAIGHSLPIKSIKPTIYQKI